MEREQLKLVEKAEEILYSALEDKEASLSRFEPLIQNYRITCQNLILEDFQLATGRNVEGKLWDAHVRVNGRFRKQLAYFKELKGKEKKPVEQRKTAKVYLDFVKSSQRFYRGYIQTLSSQFGGIAGLETVAHRFGPTAATREHARIALVQKDTLLESCHQTLVHLGDLSRYREAELNKQGKERNWGPAIGYYDLAIALKPSSGVPHNQLAIIFKTEGDHARALYHLYRAQCAMEPPPTAFANLELEFKKLREASDRSISSTGTNRESDNPRHCLQSKFPLLHARSFDEMYCQEYSDLEASVLEQLTTGVKKESLETNFVNRMILSNIAADFTAGDRWQDAPEDTRRELAFKFFQILNIRTFLALMRLLLAEYDGRSQTDVQDGANILTPVMRKILPGLRLYSFWLTSRAAILSAHLGDTRLEKSIREFWTTYVESMTKTLSSMDFGDVPRLDYLVEEDEEIAGFKPLQDEQLQQRFRSTNTPIRKPKSSEHGVKRHHPNIEMLCRFRDFAKGAIELTQSEFVPIEFVQDTGCFVVQEDWAELGRSQAPSDGGIGDSSPAAKQRETTGPGDVSLLDADSTTDDAVSQGTSVPIPLSTTMHQMVDNLVGPEPGSSSASAPLTTPAPTFASAQGDGPHETSYAVGKSTLTALDFVNQVRSWSPTEEIHALANTSLPSVLKSPFAPQPEEEAVLNSPRTSHKRERSQPTNNAHAQPASSGCTITSTPSSMSETQLSYVTNGHLLHPSLREKAFGKRQHHAACADEFSFSSSNIFAGSSVPHQSGRVEPTPPNGQG